MLDNCKSISCNYIYICIYNIYNLKVKLILWLNYNHKLTNIFIVIGNFGIHDTRNEKGSLCVL